ncbi:PREDICTED: uncharacterized protein LOC108764982 [Trachymyrmex cornetzi]|uniref:Uncharacterized protein n=1 Tax=Trachymyrmex cornetzi TaxID=471704 RepID=A0A195DRB1_9HYME|nr:PREDICTED: uncharacterized protein LOC108764982 [Trachymyrmex cornetzi]KYN15450.1 hypothetical protein ALC57_12499 [Trachymyrmex cornetzi]
MHLHQSGACGIVFIMAILGITCEISWASKRCKTVVMDVHVKRCRLGTERAKRGLEKFDLQKYTDKYETKRQEESDYSKSKNSTSHGVPQKRQLTLEQVNGIALPIVAKVINDASKARTYASGIEYQDSSLSLTTRSILNRLGYPLWAPYPFGGGFVPFRTLAYNDDLDLNLNAEELDELYNDIYERLPRASKDEAWKIFLETASKCCQNVDKCLKETTHVPCLGSQMF